MAIHKSYDIKNSFTIEKFYPCYAAVHNAGFFFPGETHDFWECSYIVKGDALVNADENVYQLKQGDFVCFKPMGFHTFIKNSTETRNLTLCFSASGSLMKHFQNRYFSLTENQCDILRLIEGCLATDFTLDFETPENTQYLSFIDEDKSNLQLMSAYITELLFSIYDNNIVGKATDMHDAQIFKKAVSYMRQNIYRSLSLQEIAVHCGVSQSGLKRLFTRFSGYPVHRYFLKMKLDTASLSLKNGESVSQTALKLGFSSQAYFSSAFRREIGVSPREYRQNLQ